MFEDGNTVQTLIKNVNDRLGFKIGEGSSQVKNEEQLIFTDIQLIYDICRFEAAWHPNNISYWCNAFSEEDLTVLSFYIS